MDRFTPFPVITGGHLRDTGEDGAVRAIQQWPVETAHLPTHLLALAWASILRVFTTEESPVFVLNHEPIKVVLFTPSIQPATLDAASLRAKHTAVFIIQDDAGGEVDASLSASCSMVWSFNRQAQTSTLHSWTGIDAAFLHQLDAQLQHTVHMQASQSDIQQNLPASMGLLEMSILNPSPVTLPGPQLLHELALSGANDANYAIECLTADGNIRSLSYRSLDRLSSKLAREIGRAASQGQRAEARAMVVPVLVPQSLELYITQLAILKAGGAFCPLNIDAPRDRIEFILQDVAASVVITQGALAARIPQSDSLAVITVDDLETKLDGEDPIEIAAETVSATPSDLAYVMYTSGSTGRPKGVGVSHLAATQSLLAHNDLIPLFNRFLQFASPTFDVSVFEIFFPLMRGATLIGSDREQMLLDISHVMTEMRVDAAELTPTVAGELLRTRAAAPNLRVLLTIGEMLTRHVVDEFGQSENSDGILHGMYGPTEAAIHCTAATHFRASDRVNLIGKPFKTVSAFIMSLEVEDSSSSPQLEPLPLGQIGELVVGGSQLADGYINRPEENAKAFIDSPVYGRLYRTGDKARMLPSGEIECFGRISSGQVKLRGQRIELGEIEHAICRAPDVRSAVAIVSNGSLAAFVLVNDKGTNDRTLRDTCRQWLPRFMVPGEFILVNQFPQLPSGKIDRKALEAEFVRHRNATESTEPQKFRDETEETIASCVVDVLDRQISPTESLTAAGLDSLAAIRLASHLLDAGIRLDVARLLEADCIDGVWQLAKELATTQPHEDTQTGLQRIRQLVADAGAARLESLGLSIEATEIEPSSHIQQAMILETTRDSKAYCNWIELEFQSSINYTAVHKAFVKLLDQNPVLRSGFVEIGLKDHSYARFTWRLPGAHIIQKCDELNYDISLMNEHDLLRPLRFQFKETPEGLQVLVHIHHALYDGWSWLLMLKDLHRLLVGEDLPPKPSYNIVTNFFIEHKLGEASNDSFLFWRDQLQGTSPATFPNFHGTMDVPPSTRDVTRTLKVSMSKLNDVSQSFRIGRQTIFQAAFCYILSSYLGSHDVVFGTVFSGRTLPVKGIETILGPCIRTLPTRINLDKMQSVTDLLLAIQNMNRKSLEHGSLPLQDIKRASGIDLNLNLFDTAFVWQESVWSENDHPSLFKEVDTAEFLEFALLLELEPRDNEIIAKATYQQSILPCEQAELLLEQIDHVASILIDSLDLPIDHIGKQLPSPILSFLGPIHKTLDNDPSLVSVIQRVASANPSKTAIELLKELDSLPVEVESISYSELNARANSLARYLLISGVEKNDLIAIVLENSIYSYICVLAVTKIGAGLLPLAPRFSLESIRSTLAALEIKFFIHHSPASNHDFLTPLGSAAQILLPESLDEYSHEDIFSNDASPHFNIVRVENVSSKDESVQHVSFTSQGLKSHIDATTNMYSLSQGSKIFQASPSASIDSLLGFFFALSAGVTLCVTNDELLATNFQEIINAMNVTHVHSTPTLASDLNPQNVPSVQQLFISGEPLTAKVHHDWAGKGLHQGYRSSALPSILSMFNDVQASAIPSNVGKRLDNMSVMVVADQSEFTLVPRGAVGELVFGGEILSQLVSTMKGAVTDSFLNHPQFGRVHRTGDYGRILPDGSIIVLGQEPSVNELECALYSSGLVENTASVLIDSPVDRQQKLATVWVPSKDAYDSEYSGQLDSVVQDLFKELNSRPDLLAVPYLLLPMEKLPMTESFQIDRASLKQEIEQMSPERINIFSQRASTGTAETLTDIESAIVMALSTVLGVDKQHIHKHTSFYKLGLDSLSAISLSRKLQESGFGRLAVSTILRYSSVSRLASAIPPMANGHSSQEPLQRTSQSVFDDDFLREVKDEISGENISVQRVYPCTPLQEAMLAAESDLDSTYFNHLLLRVHTSVDQLKTAWIEMLQRHDILRTCFWRTNDKRFAYAQVVLAGAILPWSQMKTSVQKLDQDIQKRKSEFEHQSPVNNLLPYSLTAFTDPEEQQTHLLLSIHHALYDGQAISQLLHELELSFAGQALPESIPFHRFIDYMVLAASEKSDHFWDQYLWGVSPTLLPAPKDAVGSVSQAASRQIYVDAGLSLSAFKQQCKDLSVSSLNVFHAAWARLLALHADTSDVCFGNVFSCRTVPVEDADRIIGPCFNTLPMRVNLSSTSTNADLMRIFQTHNSKILHHQLCPLRHIQRRALQGTNRLFDTLIILQTRNSDLDPQYWELLTDEGNMGFPLICEIIPNETQNTIQICFHFQPSHLTSVLADELARNFVLLINHTIQYSDAQASDRRLFATDIPRVFSTPKVQKISPGSQNLDVSRPWSLQEESLREILCQFAKVDRDFVSPNTTIFQLGLDSINAVQISGRLRKFGYTISSGDILEAASVERIASLLETREKTTEEEHFDFSAFEKQHLQMACNQLGIDSQTVQCLRPCTSVQNGMLALFTHSNGDVYFNRMSLKFSEPLDRVQLKNAWIKVVAHHEMLRTGFVQLYNQQHPFAMITYETGFELPWKDSSDIAIHEKQVLENLHQPPWEIITEFSDQVTTMSFSALHALYDAQSLETVFSDVLAVYQGKTLIHPPSISSTLGPILTESRKQSETAQSFWQGLSSEIVPCKFPDLNPIRSEKRTLLTSSICCSLSLAELESHCREIGITLQAAGQASWARLIAAYTGEQNVVFGTVLSGRNLSPSAQNAVFPCLVTVPSPSHVQGSNSELLKATQKRNASLVKNQFTPLAQIQRWIGSDEPLFDSLFVYQKFLSAPGTSVGWEVIDEETKIDYPVSIELVPRSTDLEVRMSYRSDLIPQDQAHLLLQQYNKILEHTVLSPDSRSDDYLSLGKQLLSVTPAKKKVLPSSVALLHQFVERSAAMLPEKPAFEFAFGPNADNLQKKTWNYREFNEDGNRIAHFLQDKGVSSGEMIAICFDKCPEASIAILGILKAGCAYVAIDPTAPISRKQFIMEDSQSKLLLCNQSREGDLQCLSGVDIHSIDQPGIFQGLSPTQPSLVREIQPGDTCYCLYTSGTTGTPKGCEITHDNAVQAMLAFQKLFSPHWDDDSRWLQFASFHFDVSVLEQYWSWSVGICVTSCPRDLLFEDLPAMIQKLSITHIDLTPSLARLVHPDEVPSLCRGVFITGGEALKQEILDEWGTHGVIYNGYGPTEVTIGCTMLPRMSPNDKASNIGPQFDNVGSYVFKPGSSTPVLRGGLGELCVSGPLVGKGYLNRAELTKERFQVLPEYDDRIYRTGDLVRILHDGSFQFLGRIDDQVKLRGQRLEIGEINAVIRQATAELNEVATLVIKHPKQSKDQLVSFVTKIDVNKKLHDAEVCFSNENRTLLSSIKTACHTHLPGYMVPTHVVPMTRFPLSANNKADMKVLKAIYQDLTLDELQKLSALAVDQSSKSAREEEIISILAKFIGSPNSAISSWSSIYELGLDSISVISFARSLRETGFPQAQPSLIMKYPTVAGMASALEGSTASSISQSNLHRNAKQGMEAFAHKNSHSIIESIGVIDSEIEQIAPCTPLQEGIIYHFLSSTEPLYCSSFTFGLSPSIDPSRMRAAWTQAQSQVQMLRARFSPSPDGYAQAILKKDTLPWFHIKTAPKQKVEDVCKQRFEKWILKLEGLSTRLWEVGIVSSTERSILCLNIFHALYDGNSLALLLELVAHIYIDQQRDFDRPPQFLDVLHFGPLCKDPRAEAFWREHLASCPKKTLSRQVEDQGSAVTHRIEIDTTENVDYLRKFLNVTEQAIFHACWLLALQKHFSFIPTIGIIASGRSIDVLGIANVIGPLFNTIPSNVQLRGLKSWSEVAKRCHEYHVSSIPYQFTALRDIVKWLGKSPDEPLFDSLFVFQRENADINQSTSGLWHSLDSEAQHEHPLAFEIVRNCNETLTATIAAKSEVVSPEKAQHIASSFQQILLDFAQNPDRELPYLNGVAEESQFHPGEITTELGEFITKSLSKPSFQWTPQACMIRDVIATLAEVDVQSISEETSIFEVGLDSIDAIKLSSRLGKLGLKLPVSTIMRYRNIEAMTSQLPETDYPVQNGTYPLLNQMQNSLTEFLSREKLLPHKFCQVLPATPIQEAMVMELNESGYQHYYNHEILQIEPHVDLKRLQEAWRAVVKSNPILRTSFVEVWDPEILASYAQVVHSEDVFDFQIVRLDEKPVESVMESQRTRAATSLKGCPLFTLTMATDGDARFLVLSIAHALYDGWSINLLHEDVAKSYAGNDCIRPSADAILEQILASSSEKALRFWRATLSNCEPTVFPQGKHSDSNSQLVHRAEKQFSVSLAKAETFCKRHGITMQALLVSCWSLILATYVKRLDVIFGLVLSGRNVPNSENVMFPTMNTVAMRVILHGTRLELVKYVQETLLEISEYQHFPLRRARSDPGSRQLFESLFIYQKRPPEDETSGNALYKSIGGASDVEYPVCAEVEGMGENLVARVACRGSVMGQKDTLALLGHMVDVLLAVIDNPDHQTVEFTENVMKICETVVDRDMDVHDAQDVHVSPVVPVLSATRWPPIQRSIRHVLSIVSGVPEESISREASIFELGLDSISAIKVAALLKRRSIKLAVSDMLRAGTIEKMARAVNAKSMDLSPTDVASAVKESLERIDLDSLLQSFEIGPSQVERVFPTTAGQTYFLAMHSLNPEVFYPVFYYLAPVKPSRVILEHAWVRLVEQHSVLRTIFLPTDDLQAVPYVQVVLRSVQKSVIWHESINPQFAALGTEQPSGSVPVALHACQTDKGTVLALHLHHALYDAVSLPALMNRLAQLCNQPLSQPKIEQNELSQFVAFQHVYSPMEVRRDFWQKYLGSISTLTKEEQRTGQFGVIQQDYRPGLVSHMSRIEVSAKHHGLSVQSIFLAVYARVHAQVFASTSTDSKTLQSPLVVGLYLANRSYSMEGLPGLVGPTVNIVPLRLDDKLSDDHDSLFAAARRIQEDIGQISMVDHASVSLVEIAEWTGVRIHTCVNFLRLPESAHDSNSSNTANTSDKVIFQTISQDVVAAASNSSFQWPEQAQTNGDTAWRCSAQTLNSKGPTAAIEDIFMPTLDVEAAIREDRLDFGLFAPETRLDRPTSEILMEAIRKELTALVDIYSSA